MLSTYPIDYRTDARIPAWQSTHSLSTYRIPEQAGPVGGKAEADWPGISLPFDRIDRYVTIAQLKVHIDTPEQTMATDSAERVRALRAWIDSLPTVPHVPLETLDRGELYNRGELY